MLLAIDTSAGSSVAVVDRDRGIIAEADIADTRRHAEVIGDLIASCLAEARVPIAELSGVAVGVGPGPFTGLRVGIAAAQAFCLAAGKPLVRVVSHDAVAFSFYSAGGVGPLLVTTDARRHERYWSAYRGADEFALPVRVAPPGLSRPDELEQAVSAAVAAESANDTAHAGYIRQDAQWVSAAAIGMLAETLYQHGREFAGPTPLYLRSPDVTVATGRKRVST